jgi:hypothetical protein
MSSDSVLFYTHSHTIQETSKGAFNYLLSSPLCHPKFRKEIIFFPETSDILNIILHVLYSISPAHHSPTLETLVTAVTRMPQYVIYPRAHITPTNPMHDLLLSLAPRYPFEVYTVAAQFDLNDLAVPTSAYLLSYSLSTLSDEMAERMGAIYLKRLLTLHHNRVEALKNIFLHPPYPHPSSETCGFEEQRRLTRAWSLVSAYLAWEAGPGWYQNEIYRHPKRSILIVLGLTAHGIQNTFKPLDDVLTCELCKNGLSKRLRDLVAQWISVRVSPEYQYTAQNRKYRRRLI